MAYNAPSLLWPATNDLVENIRFDQRPIFPTNDSLAQEAVVWEVDDVSRQKIEFKTKFFAWFMLNDTF